ncbi:hypothetical protein E8E13_001256 [Curvularia kusanoi]|uniref:Uncharacterized protein n=1 Tax=Curvularia kusanoi TaxID=90978 RepID=A0A9P4W736_CURKU|nr:hypothetical protein E8E13_001256 [Curvularia kusanoi]
MRLHHYLSAVAVSITLVQAAQSGCRFRNGTLLPDTGDWPKYQPCPGDDGLGTVCCATYGLLPAWSNGLTQDGCLPNGLCQNRRTTSNNERETTYWIDFCTEYGQNNATGKCLDVCQRTDETKTNQITPCDGTANSTRWCCGQSNACCASNVDVVTLDQVLGQVSSSTSIQSSTATSSSSPTSSSTSAPPTPTASGKANASGIANPGQGNGDSSSSGLGGGAIAGIAIGVIAGVALTAAALFFARRASQKKRAATVVSGGSSVAELPYNQVPQEIGATTKYAYVAEVPGAPPSELYGGDVHAQARTS